jgi:hypothetical protein
MLYVVAANGRADYDLRCCRSFDSLDYGIEALRIGDGNLAQHFSIQRDVGLLQAVDELAVSDAPLPARSVQSRNPETAEIPFLAFAPDSGIDIRSYSGFLGQPDQVARRAAMAFD